MIDKARVRQLFLAGVSAPYIAREFKVSHARIYQILKDLPKTDPRPRKEYLCKYCNLPFHCKEGWVAKLRCSDCIHKDKLERKKYWNFKHRLLCCPECKGTKFRYARGVCSNCNLKRKQRTPGPFLDHLKEYRKTYIQKNKDRINRYHKNYYATLKETNPIQWEKKIENDKIYRKKWYAAVKLDPIRYKKYLDGQRVRYFKRKQKLCLNHGTTQTSLNAGKSHDDSIEESAVKLNEHLK